MIDRVLKSALRDWCWPLVAIVVIGGVFLRVHRFGDIFLWLDETEFFNAAVYGDHPKPLIEYALDRKMRTTNTVGWPAVVWISSQVFGRTVKAARAPSIAVGTAAVLAIFLLVRTVARGMSSGNPSVPAMFAALLAAVSITQMEFSQRIYAYGATPFFSSLVILSHLYVRRSLREYPGSAPRLLIAATTYSVVAAFSLFINPTLTIAVGVSFLVLVVLFGRAFLATHREERLTLLGVGVLMGMAVVLAGLVNAKNPQYGYRPYMAPYYHAPDLGAMLFLVKHTYDLFTYHLNLFYNSALYWPQKLNLVLLPLIVICILGWVQAAAGRFGPAAKHLAFLGAVSVMVPAVLALRKNFPFGGVRQSLFLTPYLIGFTALGFYSLRFARWACVAGALFASLYLALWGINLPHFYQDRVVPFTEDDLVETWEHNGRLPLYALGDCGDAIAYMLREHPEITVKAYKYAMPPTPPVLIISTQWDIENDMWDKNFMQKLRAAGYTATLLRSRPAKYMASSQYPTSLYFPPNGLWIYSVTKQE